MNNVIRVGFGEPPCPCDACGVHDFIGQTMGLTDQATGERRNFMICSACALSHLTGLFSHSANYIAQLENESEKK